MSTNPNDSAFAYANQDDPTLPADVEPGLTKREYFAALAMQGLNAAPWCETLGSKIVATVAVEVADALIEALNEAES